VFTKAGVFLWIVAAFIFGSVVISPATFWPVAFLGWLAIPLWGIALFFTAYSLRARRWRRAIAPAVVVLAGFPFLRATLQLPGFIPREPALVLRVLSYNMGNMYGQSGRLEVRKANALAMMQWIKIQNADVLLLQEVFNYPYVSEYTPLYSLQKMGYHYYYWQHHKTPTDTLGAGMAIFSKFPLRNCTQLYHNPGFNNQILRADLVWLGRPLRVYNCHLQSVSIAHYQTQIKGKPGSTIKKNMLAVFDKLVKAYQLRALQVDILAKDIVESKAPIILGADLNDTPYSYAYWRLRFLLNNGFEQAGVGLGFTYRGHLPLGLRIDHQFSSDSLQVRSYHTYPEVHLSDHIPGIAAYSWHK
jgi:endonuclease/exonuclease/phosphatase family metal-dependent hydrolase